MNILGPNTDPCGTPQEMSKHSDLYSSIYSNLYSNLHKLLPVFLDSLPNLTLLP